MSKCDCCGEEMSDNIRMNSDFHFGNGSQFSESWELCDDCGKDINNYLKKVKRKVSSIQNRRM